MAFRCPVCNKPVEEPQADTPDVRSFFPFCSERCKLIDLGRWLDGKYQIPVDHDQIDDSAIEPTDISDV